MNLNGGKCRALKWSASQVFREIDSTAVAGANQVVRTPLRSEIRKPDLYAPKVKQAQYTVSRERHGRFKSVTTVLGSWRENDNRSDKL